LNLLIINDLVTIRPSCYPQGKAFEEIQLTSQIIQIENWKHHGKLFEKIKKEFEGWINEIKFT
jgi:hypothetical protein